MTPSEMLYPHAPDVAQRETLDDGFSAGWGFHMHPSVRYWIDSHTHLRETDAPGVLATVATWHGPLWASRLRRHVAVDGTIGQAAAFAAASAADDRFLWYCRLPWDSPDLAHLETCKSRGALGLKLHNATLMSGDFPLSAIDTPEWHRVYAAAGRLGMPVLWHVTQRRSAAPYTGGGPDAYWQAGWKRGVTFTNRDLLERFLKIVAAHRGTRFIGAHQLHIGPERLGELFLEHPNLYTDTSIGCFVAEDDVMYEADIRRWREFVLAFQDRILFGSDVVLNRENAGSELVRKHFLGHVRWVRQLRLPQEALSKIAYENFERLTGLLPAPLFPWGALRP
ncbi:MAG TPA: amidohydrolase family protein [Chthoniobacteraceae bacterium]|nr:amidohydrolase family protein [Chthoniobacteraceae bacterium]